MKNKIWWKVMKRLLLAVLVLLCINMGGSSEQTEWGQNISADQIQR